MILKPSAKTLGLEGKKEIIENNLIIINELYNNGLISNNVFQKMVKLAINDDKRSI